jgi:hypothetical protein
MHENSMKEENQLVSVKVCSRCGNETIFYTTNTLKKFTCGFCFLEELWFPNKDDRDNTYATKET